MTQIEIKSAITKFIREYFEPLGVGKYTVSHGCSASKGDKSCKDMTSVSFARDIGIKTLLVEYQNKGEPKNIRAAALRVKSCLQKIKSAYGVVAAPYISSQGGSICQQEGVGYFDLSGNCRLSFAKVLVEKKGNPNKFVVRRTQRSLFSEKAAQVIRVLLANVQKNLGVREVAKMTGVSPSHVSKVRRYLGDREWLSYGTKNLQINRPELVLNEWARATHLRKSPTFDFFSLKKPAIIEAEIATFCKSRGIDYGFTGFSAAIRYAPMVPANTVTAYVSQDIPDLAKELGFKTVDSGANITLMQPCDAGVFYDAQEFDGVRLVSPLQVYLDLINDKGRGEEAAQAILEKKVRPLWSR